MVPDQEKGQQDLDWRFLFSWIESLWIKDHLGLNQVKTDKKKEELRQ